MARLMCWVFLAGLIMGGGNLLAVAASDAEICYFHNVEHSVPLQPCQEIRLGYAEVQSISEITHNMLKVTRYLIRWTGDPGYADYYERAYFNGVLGTQHPQTAMLMYYVPLATGCTKTFGTPNDSFWCCYGTGIESFAKLGDSVYFHDSDGIYVNLLVASTVNWTEKGVRLEQVTRFPEEDTTTLIFHTAQPTDLALHVHVPYWATQGIQAKVNGKLIDVQANPSSYLTVKRTWKDGDKVEVMMPMSLHAHQMPDDPELAAIMYGPLVLAGITEQNVYFIASINDLDTWIKPVEGQPLTFHTADQPTDITFVPLNKVIDERYGVYFVITSDGSPRHKKILADAEALRRREARVVDRVKPNDEASEAKHNLQGEKTASGLFGSRTWRHATDGGWWSWELKVLPDAQMTLVCTYWGKCYLKANRYSIALDTGGIDDYLVHDDYQPKVPAGQ